MVQSSATQLVLCDLLCADTRQLALCHVDYRGCLEVCISNNDAARVLPGLQQMPLQECTGFGKRQVSLMECTVTIADGLHWHAVLSGCFPTLSLCVQCFSNTTSHCRIDLSTKLSSTMTPEIKPLRPKRSTSRQH